MSDQPGSAALAPSEPCLRCGRCAGCHAPNGDCPVPNTSCATGTCPQEPGSAALRCRCSFPGGCAERATQEDMFCDTCRRGSALHMHVGDMEGGAMHPIATSGPAVFK